LVLRRWKGGREKPETAAVTDPLAPVPEGDDQLSLRQGGPRFERLIAEQSLRLENVDLEHGFAHLADLLAFDPESPTALALLDEYLARRADDPMSLLGGCSEGYYAHEAARAYVLRRNGDLIGGVDLLTAIARANADAHYLDTWGVSWLLEEGAFESLGQSKAVFVLLCGLNSFTEFKELTQHRARHLSGYLQLAERYTSAFEIDDIAFTTLAGLHRKAGDFDGGLAVLAGSAPSWHTNIATGLLLRSKGETEAADAAFKGSLDFDPSNQSARLEAGDMHLERGDWSRAIEWYESVDRADPAKEWAAASTMYCKWQRAGGDYEDEWWKHLTQLASTSARAYDLAAGHVLPIWGCLGEFHDANANLLRQFLEEDRIREDSGNASVTITVGSLEAPSAELAWRLQFDAWRTVGTLDVTVAEIPTPDPRVSLADIAHPLWQYDGHAAEPALAPPPAHITELVSVLSSRPYRVNVNWADASRAALDLEAGDSVHLLAVMVHPPAVPPGTTALRWLPRVQLTVAQILCHLDNGWEGSARRDALYSALLGPRDWVTGAAAIALALLAVDEPLITDDVRQQFANVLAARATKGDASYENALLRAWLRLPKLFPDEEKELRRRLTAREESAND
jgi:tetratricopeptide (TPR) repeat protein